MTTNNQNRSFASALREGLTSAPQKRIPCGYLYDALGSKLFEAICLLPEYGLSRAGQRLIKQHGGELGERLPGVLRVAELGCGSGDKTQGLLKALLATPRGTELVYNPIDISADALEACIGFHANMEKLRVAPLMATYEDGLEQAAKGRLNGEQLLVLFLGSTIGNFDRHESIVFLRRLREHLIPGDALLMAADLVKPDEQMLSAYDDALGLTAAFNRNILAHLNREFGATFPVADFIHEARYNKREDRVEMHLRAPRALQVRVPAADLTLTLHAGETLWTESSHKYTVERLSGMAAQSGFVAITRWVDPAWPFSHELWLAA